MPASGTGGSKGRRTPKKAAARKPTARKRAVATRQEKASVTDLSKQRAKRTTRGRKLGPGRGNHTGLTDEVQALILQALRTGVSIDTAAAYARTSRTSVYRWLERGRRESERVALAMSKGEEVEHLPEETIFRDFRDACEHATASMAITATSTLLSIISGQMAGVTIADRRDMLKFYLSHHPDAFGAAVQRLEISGPGGAPVQLDQHVETVEEIRDQTASIVEVLMQSQIVRPALPPGDQPGEGHP